MKNIHPNAASSLSEQLRHAIRQRFDLKEDKADDDEIESRIRDGVELRGATPWILIFAIFVASVGLNVNSPAVIIGAMLISPLMGPIMGAGLGIAVYDFDLVERSLKNLAIATVISLLVSAMYFVLTPLQQAQSELLARTTPTLWDVLIALFGGLAGIIGITRRERSNVIPGVAIATALMPPVCTAGYGLATGQWHYVGGALYLYTINCVFIALATVIGIRAIHLKQHGFANTAVEKRVKTILLLLALCTALPSAYLAVNLVRDEVFKARANAFIAKEFVFEKSQVIDVKTDPGARRIDVSLIGDPVSAETLKRIETRLTDMKLDGVRIALHQMGEQHIDVTELKSSLLSDLLQESQTMIKQQDARIRTLQGELAARDALLVQAADVAAELRQLYPETQRVFFADGVEISAAGAPVRMIYLNLLTPRALPDRERRRIADWFKARMKSDAVSVRFDTGSNVSR